MSLATQSSPNNPAVPRSLTPQTAQRGQSSSTPYASEALLQGQKIVEISHNGSLYKLQATKLGKLILTK